MRWFRHGWEICQGVVKRCEGPLGVYDAHAMGVGQGELHVCVYAQRRLEMWCGVGVGIFCNKILEHGRLG
jgi:hypothetical protein